LVVHRVLTPPDGYHLAGSVGLLPMGQHDPCARFVGGAFWYASRTPDGPGTLSLRRDGTQISATGYGPGATWLLDRADAVAGLRDDVTGFADLAAAHPLVARLARTHAGVRLPATGQIFPRLLRAILEQKVTGKEAYHGYAKAVRHFSEPAPGPALPGLSDAPTKSVRGAREGDASRAPGPARAERAPIGRAPGPVERLWLPPDPAAVAAAPYWVFHPFGVEQRRADTLRRAAAAAARLEKCADSTEATTRLAAIAGIGPWTAAEVVRVVFGDADAVSIGDYHIPNTVAWALAGEPRGDDARMLALLAPFPGHRGRVCVLLEKAGIAAPRFGPRMPVRAFARF
jgi:3-methyladenine DNA glycosylase/8-oxoguanine DNA glycosylase